MFFILDTCSLSTLCFSVTLKKQTKIGKFDERWLPHALESLPHFASSEDEEEITADSETGFGEGTSKPVSGGTVLTDLRPERREIVKRAKHAVRSPLLIPGPLSPPRCPFSDAQFPFAAHGCFWEAPDPGWVSAFIPRVHH